MASYKISSHTNGVNMDATYTSGDTNAIFIGACTAKTLLTAESYLLYSIDKALYIREKKTDVCYNGACYTNIPIGEAVMVAVCYS